MKHRRFHLTLLLASLACLGDAASLRRLQQEGCPSVDDNGACGSVKDEVQCGPNGCVYDNGCLGTTSYCIQEFFEFSTLSLRMRFLYRRRTANVAGFVPSVECVLLANAGVVEDCPLIPWNECNSTIDPVRCGNLNCVYDNICFGKSSLAFVRETHGVILFYDLVLTWFPVAIIVNVSSHCCGRWPLRVYSMHRP